MLNYAYYWHLKVLKLILYDKIRYYEITMKICWLLYIISDN